jgi:hypothetical protein
LIALTRAAIVTVLLNWRGLGVITGGFGGLASRSEMLDWGKKFGVRRLHGPPILPTCVTWDDANTLGGHNAFVSLLARQAALAFF